MQPRVFNIFTLTFHFIFLCNSLFAQYDKADSIKKQIELHQKEGQISKSNTLLNRNTFLPPEYILSVINENIQISKKNNNDKDLAYSYLTLGGFWARQGEKIKAYENFVLSEEFSRKAGDIKRLGMTIMGQANIIEEPKSKIQKYQEAIQIFESQKDSLNLIRTHLNLGYFYRSLFEEVDTTKDSSYQFYKDSVWHHYQSAVNLNRIFQSPEMFALYKYRMAEWESDNGNYEIAIKLLDEAKKEFSEIGMVEWEIYCLLLQSDVQNNVGNTNAALDLASQSEILIKKQGFIDQLVYVYRIYTEIYKNAANFPQAFYYSQLYNELSLEQAEKNSQDKIKTLTLEQRINENQRILDDYKTKQTIYLVIIFLVVFILILGSVLFYTVSKSNKRKISNIEKDKIITEIKLQNQNIKKELLREKVKFNQEHLISFANQVNQIDSFLEALKNQIKKLPLDNENKEIINGLKISFHEVLQDQNQLQQIISLNSEMNQEFFLSVGRMHPELTKGDKHLLSFLIRGMSSKEISEILKITPESVNKKRYRLRRKIELDKGTSFMDFYEDIVNSSQ